MSYLDQFLSDISNIDQASTQWTLAQLFLSLEKDMTPQQIKAAKDLLTHNLSHHNDWIVLHTSMQTLAHWAETDEKLKSWLLPHLERLSIDSRKSVAGRAQKLLAKFT